MLTAAQRAGVAAFPEPLPLGRSVERIFAERVSQLAPAAQHLLLVGPPRKPEISRRSCEPPLSRAAAWTRWRRQNEPV